jgi:hypothetical protein
MFCTDRKKDLQLAGFLFALSSDGLYPPILNMVVPQTSQTAFVAGFPFFIVTFSGFFPSLFARHFTQYIIN